MVIETHGYQMSKGRNEVEQILDANNIGVEYRFFGKSLPDSLQWEYLTIEQATADLHAIHELLKEIDKGKWISTSILFLQRWIPLVAIELQITSITSIT